MKFLERRLPRVTMRLRQGKKTALALHFNDFGGICVQIHPHQQIRRSELTEVICRKKALLGDPHQAGVLGPLHDFAIDNELLVADRQNKLPVTARVEIGQESTNANVVRIALANECRQVELRSACVKHGYLCCAHLSLFENLHITTGEATGKPEHMHSVGNA